VKIVTSIFTNPNDLSVVSFLSLLTFTMLKNTNNDLKLNSAVCFYMYILTFFLIIISLSRTVFIFFLLFSFFYFRAVGLKKFNKYFILFSFILISILFLYLLQTEASGNNDLLSVIQRRIKSVLDIMLGNELDGSSSSRLSNYGYFFSNINNIEFFGMGNKNYFDFYKSASFNIDIYRYSPHSFVFEIILAFGYPMLGLILMFFLCYLYIIKNCNRRLFRGLFFVFFIFFIFSFVMSSIFRTPIIYMLFLFSSYPVWVNIYHHKSLSLRNN